MATISQNPIESSIRKKLKETFTPTHMDVINESYMHSVPKGSETHFKVVVISDKFSDMPLIGVTYFIIIISFSIYKLLITLICPFRDTGLLWTY